MHAPKSVYILNNNTNDDDDDKNNEQHSSTFLVSYMNANSMNAVPL